MIAPTISYLQDVAQPPPITTLIHDSVRYSSPYRNSELKLFRAQPMSVFLQNHVLGGVLYLYLGKEIV